jgi:hypothetical protein
LVCDIVLVDTISRKSLLVPFIPLVYDD